LNAGRYRQALGIDELSRFSDDVAMRSWTTFICRVSASCCSYSSIIVAPDDPRARIPLVRTNQNQRAISCAMEKKLPARKNHPLVILGGSSRAAEAC
jgi:hypothetical protein